MPPPMEGVGGMSAFPCRLPWGVGGGHIPKTQKAPADTVGGRPKIQYSYSIGFSFAVKWRRMGGSSTIS